MIKDVRWSALSRKNLREIKKFFDQRNASTDYSAKLLKTFKESAKLIQKNPFSGISTSDKNLRGFIVLNYIIFYEILDERILILFIWDCRKDPKQLEKFIKSSPLT